MKRLLIYSGAIVLVLVFWFGESRKFFCLDNGRCITVWKTYNGVCYIIPGKYYGILRPSSSNYIQTSNLSDADIIWQKDSSDMIVSIESNSKIINQSFTRDKILDYNSNKTYYDSVFTYYDGKYRRYNKGLDRMSIFIRDNYAIDKDGKHL
jgi:hypothetical protein